MDEKYLKKISTCLDIRKIQNKTSVRFHFILIRMTKINKKCKRNTHPLLERVLTLIATMETNVPIVQEDGTICTSRLSQTTSGHIIVLLQRHLASNIYCCSTHNNQKLKTAQILGQVMKMWYIYTMNYHSAIKP